MKKIVGVLLLGAMLLSGCSAFSVDVAPNTQTGIPNQSITTTAQTTVTSDIAEITQTEITMDGDIIYSGEDIIISLIDITGTESVELSIANVSGHNLECSLCTIVINDCAIDCPDTHMIYDSEVQNLKYNISSSDLLKYKITDIQSIGFIFNIITAVSEITIDIPYITYDVSDQTYNYKPIGDIVYAGRALDIYLEDGDYFNDTIVTYYNKRDYPLYVRLSNIDAEIDEQSKNIRNDLFCAYMVPPHGYYRTVTDSIDNLDYLGGTFIASYRDNGQWVTDVESDEIVIFDKRPVFRTISNETIYDDNGIEIIINRIDGTQSINFEIHNNSSKDITCAIRSIAINNCDLNLDTFGQVYGILPDKIVSESIDISGCRYYDMYKIETIDMYIEAWDRDSYDDIMQEIIHIDLTDEPSAKYEPAGDLVYSDNALDMYVYQTGDNFEDVYAIYYNKTDDILDICVTDTSINNIMLTNSGILNVYNVLPNCYAATGAPSRYITIYSPQLVEIDEKGLEPIEIICGKIYRVNQDYDYDSSEEIVIIG